MPLKTRVLIEGDLQSASTSVVISSVSGTRQSSKPANVTLAAQVCASSKGKSIGSPWQSPLSQVCPAPQRYQVRPESGSWAKPLLMR